MGRLLLTLWVLSGVAQAADPPTLLVQAPGPGAPLWVGELPAGKPFRLAVRQTKGFKPERVALWRSGRGGCGDRPNDARVLRAGPVAEVQGEPAVLFMLPRLPINSDWCVALDGLRSVADAERAAIRDALSALLARMAEPEAPTLRAQRLDALAKELGDRAQRTVRCADRSLCPDGGERQLVDALNAWVEGQGDASAFTLAEQLGDDLRAARDRRQGALDKLRREVAAPADSPEGQRLAGAVRPGLQAALALARDAGLLDAATPAVDENGAPLDGVDAVRQALRAAATAGETGWDASGCTTRRSGCVALRKAWVAARRSAEAIDQELTTADALRGARETVLTAFDTWATGFPITAKTSADTEVPAYTERSAWYIGADVGVAMPFYGTEASLAAYFGASFSFVPVDKDVPLADDDGFLQRFSVVLGVTLNDPVDTAGTVSPALGEVSLLAGAGFRLTDYLRASAGGLLYRQEDPDPTVTGAHLRVAPFVGLSVDIDVAGMLKSEYSGVQGL